MKIATVMTAALMGTLLHAGTAIAAPAKKTSTTSLTADETATLQFMREEEKLARDVYLTLDGYWGAKTPVFASIAASEQKHTDAVEALLDKYRVTDPVVRDDVGVFANAELQALFDSLVDKGARSLSDGLHVGALIEEVDIEDIVAAIKATDERAAIITYSNLLDGSENHLRAFVSVIEAQGIDYQAQVLTPAEVAVILAADSDSGQ